MAEPKKVTGVNPVYIKLLIGMAFLYVISTTYMISQLIWKVGELEHAMSHLAGGTHHHE